MHPACPTGGSAILALIAAVGILVFAPAAVAESPCMPWEVYRPILRMCEAKTDTSAQPAAPSKVGLRERGRTPPSVQETARPKVVVRERGRTHSVEKPERPKVVRPERGRTQHSVREPAGRKVAVRERGRTQHSVREPAPRKVVVRERARTQHSVVKPARPKIAVSEVRREKEVVRARDPEPMSTIPLPEPKSLGSLNPRPGWKQDW